MGEIRAAYLAALQQGRRDPVLSPYLWPSEVGGCVRRAMLRILGLPTGQEALSPATLDRFESGTAFERSLVYQLQRQYGERFARQVRLETDRWVAKCDGALDVAGPSPLLLEIKVTDSKWWDYNQELPRREHVLQLATYGLLFERVHARRPRLVLYYRAWGHYAEFRVAVKQDPPAILVDGEVDDAARSLVLPIDLRAEVQRLEDAYDLLPPPEEERVLPERIPPRLADPRDGCLFRGKPSCPFYDHCWPDDIVGSEGILYVQPV